MKLKATIRRRVHATGWVVTIGIPEREFYKNRVCWWIFVWARTWNFNTFEEAVEELPHLWNDIRTA